MKRLTSKTNSKPYSYKYLDIDDCMEGTPIEKLGQLEDIEEELGIDLVTISKAFAIIKEKRVNVYWLIVCFRKGGLEKYNDYYDMLFLSEYMLTQEEFDLLRRVLG